MAHSWIAREGYELFSATRVPSPATASCRTDHFVKGILLRLALCMRIHVHRAALSFAFFPSFHHGSSPGPSSSSFSSWALPSFVPGLPMDTPNSSSSSDACLST